MALPLEAEGLATACSARRPAPAHADAAPFASSTLSRAFVHPPVQQIMSHSYYRPDVMQDAEVRAVNKIQCFGPFYWFAYVRADDWKMP